jgi:hypothetical protein
MVAAKTEKRATWHEKFKTEQEEFPGDLHLVWREDPAR